MIGIDISDHSMKIVRLAKGRDRRLLAHCWQAVPDACIEKGVIKNVPVVQKILLQAFKECRLDTHDDVVASIPETQSFLRVVEIPAMGDNEISEAVQWEVAQHIPLGVENVYLDWQSVEAGHRPAAGKREVLVGAAEKNVVDPLLAVLTGVGLEVAALELEGQAIVRALISREMGLRKGLLVVDLGGSATNVIVFDHGTIRFTASLQKGSADLLHALPGAEAQTIDGPPKPIVADTQVALASKLMPGLEEIVIEIQGIVEFYNGIDTDHEVKEIVLTGGGANLPGFDQAVLKYFTNVHVQRGNPWVNILAPGKTSQPPLPLQESVHYSTALGLALRQLS